MWMTFERSLDGVVGRMLSWFTHPPLHPAAGGEEVERPSQAVTAVAERSVERVPEAVAERIDAFVEGVAVGVSGAGDALDEKLLEALAAAAGGLTVNKLARRIGEKRPVLLPGLKRLEASGRIRSEGKGINLSYRLTET